MCFSPDPALGHYLDERQKHVTQAGLRWQRDLRAFVGETKWPKSLNNDLQTLVEQTQWPKSLDMDALTAYYEPAVDHTIGQSQEDEAFNLVPDNLELDNRHAEFLTQQDHGEEDEVERLLNKADFWEPGIQSPPDS